MIRAATGAGTASSTSAKTPAACSACASSSSRRAFAGYWLIGGALYLGARGLGGLGDYRRARHLLAFALAPLALSLLLLWPVELAAFGTDVFRRGGADEGAAGTLFEGLELAFAVWSASLLLVGVRAVHGWSWWRSLGALGLVALFLAAFAYLPSVL